MVPHTLLARSYHAKRPCGGTPNRQGGRAEEEGHRPGFGAVFCLSVINMRVSKGKTSVRVRGAYQIIGEWRKASSRLRERKNENVPA